MARRSRSFLAGIGLLAAMSAAQAQIYRVVLSGANENPPIASNGTGSAVITLNTATHEMRVFATFSGLTGNTTASHIHCCVAPPGNAGVATTTPSFVGFPLGVTNGSWDRIYDMSVASTWNAAFMTPNGGTPASAEAAFMAGVALGRPYLNVHSSFAPGGEIRGQLVLNSFAANASLSAGGHNAAVALDALGAGTGALSNSLVSLAALSSASQAVAINLLTPVASNGAQLVVLESITTAFDQIGNRLDGLRLPENVVPSALGGVPATAGTGFWIAGNGVDSRKDPDNGFAGYENSGWGGALGADRSLSEGLYVGAALSYSDSSLKFRDQSAGSKTDMRNTQISFYAAEDVGTAYIDFIAAYGWQKYESTRNAGAIGVASGAFDGTAWGVRIGGGFPRALSSSTSITPQVRVDWDSIKQDAYTESGAGPLSLAVDSGSAKRLRGSFGVQLDFVSDRGDLKMRPFLRAFAHHNFTNDGIDATASFVAGGGSFITPAQEPEKNPYTVGAGINFYSKRSFAAALTYNGTFADSYHSNVYDARLRWMF